MSDGKHTPGPWKAAPFRVQIPLADGGYATGPLMSYLVGCRASVEGMTVTFGSERVADHYLAAAAPDLLRELRKARDYVHSQREGVLAVHTRADGTMDAAREELVGEEDELLAYIDDAIAKATGGDA